MTDWGAALGEDQHACFVVRDHLTDLAKTAADTLTCVIDALMAVVGLLGASGASIEIPIWGELKLGEAVWKAVGIIDNVRKVVAYSGPAQPGSGAEMNRSAAEVLRRSVEKMARARAEFDAVHGEVEAELAEAVKEFPALDVEQEEQLAERYRPGKSGAVLRDLQARVDRGETTWEDIKRGRADPELTERYIASQTKLGQVIKAAADGRDMAEFLEEEHRLGHYFTPDARAKNRGSSVPVVKSPDVRNGDEDLSDRQSWMARRPGQR